MVGEIKKPLYVLLEATCCLLLMPGELSDVVVEAAAPRRLALAT
jgi:hypothetical protein